LIHRVNFKVKRSSPPNLPKSQKWCQIWIPGFFPFWKGFEVGRPPPLFSLNFQKINPSYVRNRSSDQRKILDLRLGGQNQHVCQISLNSERVGFRIVFFWMIWHGMTQQQTLVQMSNVRIGIWGLGSSTEQTQCSSCSLSFTVFIVLILFCLTGVFFRKVPTNVFSYYSQRNPTTCCQFVPAPGRADMIKWFNAFETDSQPVNVNHVGLERNYGPFDDFVDHLQIFVCFFELGCRYPDLTLGRNVLSCFVQDLQKLPTKQCIAGMGKLRPAKTFCESAGQSYAHG